MLNLIPLRLHSSPDMVEGGVITRNEKEVARTICSRTKINDPRIEGPFETGLGFKDFEDQHSLESVCPTL